MDALFVPHEAEIVKGITLSSRLPDDKQIWAEAPNGLFTVRSAYKLTITMSCPVTRGESSDSSPVHSFWMTMWNLPIPHKVRHFGWRARRDNLPTKTNLMKRKVLQEDSCDICGVESESVGHILLRCLKAQEAWEYSKFSSSLNLVGCQTFYDLMWLPFMIEGADENQAARAVTIAWALWHNRNECGSFTPIKTNVDGAIFSAQKVVGLVVAIQNDKRRVEVALSKKILAPLGAVEAKAKAFKAGLLFAKGIGIQDVVLEGGSIIVYNALCEKSFPPASVESVVLGVLEMAKDLRRVEFSYVRRQGNKPAHLLAKHASCIDDYIAWIEENPCCIE
ncbi:hypothetical protein SO802_018800 [Lithocarpus litseifolius]|uniref:Reverse transcriptase zinc-binding domain-containing protein n=1 Tax=Lithocarpus litseifolius TaxID=425828 RepID=A0AAW2CP71_9ROSI